jgi:hypothetical protein
VCRPMNKRFKEVEMDSTIQNSVETRPQSINRDRSDSISSVDVINKSASKSIDNDEEKYGLHLDTEVSSCVYYNYIRAREKLPSSGSMLTKRLTETQDNSP